MGTGTGTDARQSKHRAFLFLKIKSTADSSSVCDIDIIFLFEDRIYDFPDRLGLFSCCVALDPHLRIWILFWKGPYVHCVLYRFVSVRCEAAYGIGGGFIFQETKTLCSPIRTRLYWYRYPLNGSSILRTETLLFK
jgi:hypothetical protein